MKIKVNLIDPISAGKFSEEENRDCSVRALANAADIDYDEAHDLLAYHGRPDKRGVDHKTLMSAYRDAGFTKIKTFGTTKMAWHFNFNYKDIIESKEKGITLDNFCKKYNKGRFIVVYAGHALAVVNGSIIDKFSNLANKRVTVAFAKSWK
jgi:hypothetical protein